MNFCQKGVFLRPTLYSPRFDRTWKDRAQAIFGAACDIRQYKEVFGGNGFTRHDLARRGMIWRDFRGHPIRGRGPERLGKIPQRYGEIWPDSTCARFGSGFQDLAKVWHIRPGAEGFGQGAAGFVKILRYAARLDLLRREVGISPGSG